MKKETHDKLIQKTLVASTGASMRLAGSKVSDKKVKELLGLKEIKRMGRGRGTRYVKI